MPGQGGIVKLLCADHERFLALHQALLTGGGRPVLAIPPPILARAFARGRLGWVLWHRSLTPERILHDQPKPAD